MLDLAFVTILAAIATGLGAWLLRRFGADLDSAVDRLALALPLGLGAIALAVLGLGEIGELGLRGIVTILAIAAIPASLGARGLLDDLRSLASYSRGPDREGGFATWVDIAFVIGLGVCLVGTLICAFPPVTDGDALSYHLQVPKWFLERGSVAFDPDLPATAYPMVTEMLYAVALALRGPVACRLVHWVIGLAFALNVTALARPALGPRAWWAGTIALLVPAVSNGMSAPLNDVSLAAFGSAALLAWMSFSAKPSIRAAALVGVYTGLALGVKYPALVLAALLGLAIILRIRPIVGFPSLGGPNNSIARATPELIENLSVVQCDRNSLNRFAHVAAFIASATLVGGCWYVRASYHTGNPVYPFFRRVFGGAGLDQVLAMQRRPLPLTIWSSLTALGPLTLEPARFDSFFHQLGPVFLLFLPPILWMRPRPPRSVLTLLAIGYAFLLLCMTQRQSTRFLLIAAAPFSVCVAWVADEWCRKNTWLSRALVSGLVLVLAFEAAWSLARTRHVIKVVLGAESTDAYLTRKEPTYRVGQWIAANLPPDAKVVGQDHRGFYLPREYTMERLHRLRTGLGTHGEDARAVIQHFEDAGYTHLLLCPPDPEDAVTFDPALSQLLVPWLNGREPIYRRSLADADGVIRHYSIYPILDQVAEGASGRRAR